MTGLPPPPGFLALSHASGSQSPEAGAAARAARSVSGQPVAVAGGDSLTVAFWGLGGLAEVSKGPVVLSRSPRCHEADLRGPDVLRLLRSDGADELHAVLAPFAAVNLSDDRTTLTGATDVLGFRHLYVRRGPGRAALSTSARGLAEGSVAAIDDEAVAVQSLLGWQVGLRTPFAGVTKVPPGRVVSLAAGVARSDEPVARRRAPRLSLDEAVHAASSLLRTTVAAYVDEHPDAVLQLTGGQDSRILLAAIPPRRRRDVVAMTLAVPGSPDAAIAGGLAKQFGMTHQVITLDGLADLEPHAAYDLCVRAAARLECSADPLAFASLAWAEAQLDQAPRISGLGGEFVRGFYYFGRARLEPITAQRVERLAKWRMFANEAASADALDPEFAQWARETTLAILEEAFHAAGDDWFTATDEFYLQQRMHRWAGVLATATCFDRSTVNPMLDDRFIAIARGLSPVAKRNSQFLSRILVALDPGLAKIPLDGRPAPWAYAHPGLGSSARLSALQARKISGKIRQRVVSGHRPPAGGAILAAKVIEHWRSDPSALEATRGLGVLRSGLVDELCAGRFRPDPATVAFVLNLAVARQPQPQAMSEADPARRATPAAAGSAEGAP